MKNKEKIHILGETREKLYLMVLIIPVIAAVAFATIGCRDYANFWSSLLIYQNNPEGNARICEEIINWEGYISILDQFRLYLSGFEVAMLISLMTIGARVFYLKKKTNAYFTLARLPKGNKYMAEIYIKPILCALLIYLIRLVYIFVYIGSLARFEGSEQLVGVMLKNIWRILL